MNAAQDFVEDFTGYRFDERIETYHKNVGLSFTAFKHLMRSPAHCQAYVSGKVEDSESETASRRLGRLTHLALEAHLSKSFKIEDRVACVEGRWGGDTKKKVESLRASGLEVCKPDELELAKNMAGLGPVGGVLRNPRALEYLRDGACEVSAYAIEPTTGVLIKCRPDYLRKDAAMADYKTCTDASPDGFRVQARRQKYHYQAAFYSLVISILVGKQKENFGHIAIEDSYPFETNVFVCGPETIARCQAEILQHLARYRQCQDEDSWVGYDREILPFDVEFYDL